MRAAPSPRPNTPLVRQLAGPLIPTIDPDHPGVTSAKTLIELSASTVVCGVKLHCSAAPFDTPNDERRVDGDTPWERRMARSGRGQIPRQFTRLGDRDRLPGPAGGDGGGRRLRHRGGRRAATQRDVRYRPATLDPVGVLDQPGARGRGPGSAGPVGAGSVGRRPGSAGSGRPRRCGGRRRCWRTFRVWWTGWRWWRGWPAGVAARRDTALLPMGFAGAFRRPELTGLTVADVTLHRTDELHVRLRTSKTDQESTTAGSDRYWNTTSPPACIAGSGPPQQFRQTTRPARRGSGSGDRPRASIVGGTSMWVAKAAATLAAAADPMT